MEVVLAEHGWQSVLAGHERTAVAVSWHPTALLLHAGCVSSESVTGEALTGRIGILLVFLSSPSCFAMWQKAPLLCTERVVRQG
eukprot:scaffold79193_cov63-Phaeocystis_antarctica.AAC.8